jgi:hypothetical protein
MITIRSLSSNISKGQSSVAVKYIFQQLNQIYEKNKDSIQIVFCSHNNNGTKVHLKVPSSERPGLFFDVVLWFNTENKIDLDTQIKVFSNSPSFAYNFAYIFNKDKSLLYPDKFPSNFLNTPPKVRNPLQISSFDKHIFISIKKLIGRDLKSLTVTFQGNAEPEIATFKEKNP